MNLLGAFGAKVGLDDDRSPRADYFLPATTVQKLPDRRKEIGTIGPTKKNVTFHDKDPRCLRGCGFTIKDPACCPDSCRLSLTMLSTLVNRASQLSEATRSIRRR